MSQKLQFLKWPLEAGPKNELITIERPIKKKEERKSLQK